MRDHFVTSQRLNAVRRHPRKSLTCVNAADGWRWRWDLNSGCARSRQRPSVLLAPAHGSAHALRPALVVLGCPPFPAFCDQSRDHSRTPSATAGTVTA